MRLFLKNWPFFWWFLGCLGSGVPGGHKTPLFTENPWWDPPTRILSFSLFFSLYVAVKVPLVRHCRMRHIIGARLLYKNKSCIPQWGVSSCRVSTGSYDNLCVCVENNIILYIIIILYIVSAHMYVYCLLWLCICKYIYIDDNHTFVWSVSKPKRLHACCQQYVQICSPEISIR